MRLTECQFLARLVWELGSRCVLGFRVSPNLKLCPSLKQYFALRWFCHAPLHPQCLPPPSDGQSSKTLDFNFSDWKCVASNWSGTRKRSPVTQPLMVKCFSGCVKLFKLVQILSSTLCQLLYGLSSQFYIYNSGKEEKAVWGMILPRWKSSRSWTEVSSPTHTWGFR